MYVTRVNNRLYGLLATAALHSELYNLNLHALRASVGALNPRLVRHFREKETSISLYLPTGVVSAFCPLMAAITAPRELGLSVPIPRPGYSL